MRWADIIDSAAFESAKMAVERKEPELQLMTLVEHLGDDAFLAKMVPRLLEQPLCEVARAPEVTLAYEPLGRALDDFVGKVRSRAETIGVSVLVDLSDELIETAGKFVTYALYPESAYSVLLSRSKSKCKISVGYNPWSPVPRTHDIAAICERHGGGGHPVVGAIGAAARSRRAGEGPRAVDSRRAGRLSLWTSEGPLVVGHRGGRGAGWPRENTIAAFEQARAQGARAIELDVRTCDREVIVLHDAPSEGLARPSAQRACRSFRTCSRGRVSATWP